ncbi:MAG: sigma factor-like helix-turn-helix DNA-binding protein [Lachnospiraceae bacterium]|nr:sigma factor-like helix-turn-helix DNA-binding protein [Lachnospiraceae bacterium]
MSDLNTAEWKAQKKRKKQQFQALQNKPYEEKVRRAELRAFEFQSEMDGRLKNCHVSVGGLDSITLLMFLRYLRIDVPAISVSSVEDKSIQEIRDSTDRQIFELSFLEGKKQREVAEEVGYSEGRISQIISSYFKD